MPSVTLPIGTGGGLIDIVVRFINSERDPQPSAAIKSPNRQLIRALIDTGADCTVVDHSIIRVLGLQPEGCMLVHSPSASAIPRVAHRFPLALGIWLEREFFEPPVQLSAIESDFAGLPFQALLGRDIVNLAKMVYDGPSGTFTLTF